MATITVNGKTYTSKKGDEITTQQVEDILILLTEKAPELLKDFIDNYLAKSEEERKTKAAGFIMFSGLVVKLLRSGIHREFVSILFLDDADNYPELKDLKQVGFVKAIEVANDFFQVIAAQSNALKTLFSDPTLKGLVNQTKSAQE